MSWQADIPSFPKCVNDLPSGPQRRRAESTWDAGHTLLSGIDAWEQMFRRPNAFDYDKAESISKAGRTAITILGAMRVRCDSIQASEDPMSSFHAIAWPFPPSECLDPEWYTDAANYRNTVVPQLAMMTQILRPDIENLLDVLRQSVDAAFRDDKSPSPEDPIEDVLSGQLLTLYRYLKARTRRTPFDSLAKLKCWRGDAPTDVAIEKALKRLRTELNKIPISLVIEAKDRRTYLDK